MEQSFVVWQKISNNIIQINGNFISWVSLRILFHAEENIEYFLYVYVYYIYIHFVTDDCMIVWMLINKEKFAHMF